MKPTWLLRLPEIREELAALEVPVLDRGMVERIFRVRRRRALQLMQYFGGWQAGQACLVDRLDLLRQLVPLEESMEFAREQHRRQRLLESLEQIRRHRAAARVRLPVAATAYAGALCALPPGVCLQPGSLQVEFGEPEDLLAKLYQLAQAVAQDFDGFRRIVTDRAVPGSSKESEPSCATSNRLAAG
jgi:hypothetical protein